MGDSEWCADKDSNQFSSQKSVIGARGCEKCDLLETRLFNAHVELKTTRLIIELLLEDVKRPGEAFEGAEWDIEGEPQLSSNESNRIHIQVNRHSTRTINLKELNEMWVKTRDCMGSMFNLKDVIKPTEASESLRDYVHNVENQSYTAKFKREEFAQIMNSIPVIINGTVQFICDKVPQITHRMKVTATSCGVQTSVITADRNDEIELPKGNKNLNYKSDQTIPNNKIKMTLTSKEEDNTSANNMMNSKTSNLSNYVNIKDSVKNCEKVNKDSHKILLIGDIHIKRCAFELRQILNREYEVLGFSKPGAKTSDILKTAENEIASLSTNDFLILWVGSNDISKNNILDARRSFTKFFNDHMGVNIIFIQAPNRHDLVSTSCINKEVIKFKRQVMKIIKSYPNIKSLEIELQRNYFTRRGQHLNNIGKEQAATELAKLIQQHFSKVGTEIIQIIWKEHNLQETNVVVQNEIRELVVTRNQENLLKCNTIQCDNDVGKNKKSLRTRKMPIRNPMIFYGKWTQGV
jgi:hypothetical protein